MKKSREEILADVMLLLRRLADDWEYGGDITEDTYLLADTLTRSKRDTNRNTHRITNRCADSDPCND